MSRLEKHLKTLNKEQLSAVQQIEGPVLVTAGPGTGKTQLLSLRVANILNETDIAPYNVLCLTFTDNASRNMLERLEKVIGQPAYHTTIHTFHSFGAEIINQYPEYFNKRPLLQPIDELGSYELLSDIFQTLPHADPLSTKLGEEYLYLKDVGQAISWLKHNALSPADFEKFLKINERSYKDINKLITAKNIWSPTSPKHLPAYRNIAKKLENIDYPINIPGFENYAKLMTDSLELALQQTPTTGRYAPAITKWRDEWLLKKTADKFVLKDSGDNYTKLHSLHSIYKALQLSMSKLGLYDFDDMILEVVRALETEAELKLNLQEKYQYVLVDEFQDTNKAQLRILQALGDNPVNEGKPNIMAVGDPNQAIYAFQGAESSNIQNFLESFKAVKQINLKQNYRSSQRILNASQSVLTAYEIPNVKLKANKSFKREDVAQQVFTSELAQYNWIASKVEKLIKEGMSPDQISITAPKHKYLERLMPYLATKNVPVAYERRENILEAPIILQVLHMAELVVAISNNEHHKCDVLFSKVLNFDFLNLEYQDLLEISLQSYKTKQHWQVLLLRSKSKSLKAITKWFISLAKKSSILPMEYILDELSGVRGKTTKSVFVSPFYEYYFSKEKLESVPSEYLTYLGQLSTLRQKLRSWKPNKTLFIDDLVSFVDLHTQAKIKITDTNPHTQSVNAVQVMTAYKAKGLEFEVAFVINAQDEVWGPKARQRTAKIRFPKNMPIKPAGDSEYDKLRLFYVALTRAKHSLYLTSYNTDLNNKKSLGLSFIGGNSVESETVISEFKPNIITTKTEPEAVQILSTDWAYKYQQVIADRPALFKPLLERYQLSVTHLNNYLDVVNGGPQQFLLHNLLRFPEAISPSAAYGDAMHKTVQWIYNEIKDSQGIPSQQVINTKFKELLTIKHLPKNDFDKLLKRGMEALQTYMAKNKQLLKPTHIIERNFAHEGVVVGGAKLTGKIDKIIPTDQSQMLVVDYKTGKPSKSWTGKDEFEKQKLHRYKRQLVFYKLLIENSAVYSGKHSVNEGALEFFEANNEGILLDPLKTYISQDDANYLTKLIAVVWRNIMNLSFPDTSHYPKNLKGNLQFEKDLLKNFK